MSIEAMKQALEFVSDIQRGRYKGNADEIITVLRTAIEQADEQEAWKTSDTAYRPEGLPQDFIKHEVDSFDDWSEWVCPDPTQYFMQCCDCGLVHEMQFNVVKYSAGDECEDVDDPYVQAVFRARRTTPPAAQQEPVAWMHRHIDGNVITHKPADLNRHPDRWTPLYKNPTPCETCQALARTVMMDQTAHDTPPAAQRQPLTDQQIGKILDDPNIAEAHQGNWLVLPYAFARAIEAAHGIKEKNT